LTEFAHTITWWYIVDISIVLGGFVLSDSSFRMSEGVFKGLVDHLWAPGSSLKLVPAINVSVLCLLILLLCVAHTKIATIHLVVLASLAVGLLLSVNFFYYEYQKLRDAADTDGDKKQD